MRYNVRMKTQIRTLLAAGAIAALPAFADPSAEYVSERFEQQGEIGNYDISVTLPKGAFVKFDGRRLAVDRTSAAGRQEWTLRLPGPYTKREKPGANTKIVIEVFHRKGDAFDKSSIKVARSSGTPTLYLAGDSTMTDNRKEPWASWGQMAPAFFKKGISVSNFARSGLALCTFEEEGRLDRILEHFKPGDYLFIAFGHNDQKRKGEEPENGYTRRLNEWIDKIQARGGNVIIGTPIERRRFRKDGTQGPRTLDGYAAAARAVAEKRKLPLVDLNEASYAMMGVMGEKGSTRLQRWCEAGFFPGLTEAVNDNTHHSVYGAYEMARIAVAGIAEKVPALKPLIREKYRSFNHLKPDPDPGIPPSTGCGYDVRKPAGN